MLIGLSVFIFVVLIALTIAVASANKNEMERNSSTINQAKSFYDFEMKSIDGTLIHFKKFKGKKVLLVNVASECGYTPQYKDLQLLHEKYGKKLIVLGFPSNNFGGQEPGTNVEIKQFCTKNYGVTFILFEKVSVKGEDQCELYKWLSSKESNGWNDLEPSWNFCKYLINEKGELIKYFPSSINPMSKEITSLL